jgi:hypothetical protein
MLKRIIKSWLVIGFVLFLVSGNLQAATFYVASSGADTAAGSQDQPWKTLQQAAERVSTGDTVIIKSGVYKGFRATAGGSENHPITFQAEAGGSVVINQPGPGNKKGSIIEIEEYNWWVLQGLEVTRAPRRAGIDIRVAHHVTIRNCYCHHNRKWGIFTAFVEFFTAESNVCSYSVEEHGIYHSNSGDNAVVRYNTCHHNNACGIQINADPSMGGDGISSNNIISANILYENGAAGGAAINLASVRDSLIDTNLIYHNHGGGIAAWDDDQGPQWGCKNNRFYHNTVHIPTDGRWAIHLSNDSSGNNISNNILVHDHADKGGLEIDASSITGLVSNYNVMVNVSVDENLMTLASWQTTYGQDLHSFTESPGTTFVSPGTDYHLQSGSRARDGGTQLSGITTDLEGTARPYGSACDLGAYEYHGEAGGDNNSNGSGVPVPVLLVNGSAQAVTVSTDSTLSISIGMDLAGSSGVPADWWFAEVSTAGVSCFDLTRMMMVQGLRPIYQGPLLGFNPFPIMDLVHPAPGIYDFYFGIDMEMNGSLELDSFAYQTVHVEVRSGTAATAGHITYQFGNQVYRIKAEKGAVPENISAELQTLSAQPVGAADGNLNMSPDGNWLVLETERFNPACVGWACLAVVKADLSSGNAIIANGDVVHPEGFPAISSGGKLVVYPNRAGAHTVNLWKVQRSDTSGQGPWESPVELTAQSTYQWNYRPAISSDSSRILFNCTDMPYNGNTSICQVNADGSGFKRILGPADSPAGYPDTGELYSPDFAPDGSIVFEADWAGEQLWRLPPESNVPVLINDNFHNDNSPCVLPNGSIASLWLDRPGGAGFHELKVMSPDGSNYFMLLPDVDINDIGLGGGN